MRGDERRLRLRERGLCAIERGDVRRRIDLIETLPRFHFAAFHEIPLQHDAVHTRDDLRNEERTDPARQFDDHRNRRGFSDNDADFGYLRSGRRGLLAAGGDKRNGGQCRDKTN